MPSRNPKRVADGASVSHGAARSVLDDGEPNATLDRSGIERVLGVFRPIASPGCVSLLRH